MSPGLKPTSSPSSDARTKVRAYLRSKNSTKHCLGRLGVHDLLGHPVGPEGLLDGTRQRRAIQHRSDEVLHCGVMHVGMRGQVLFAQVAAAVEEPQGRPVE